MAKKVQKKSLPKPRNPFTLHLIKRPSGPQQKPYKAVRKAMKQTMKEQQ